MFLPDFNPLWWLNCHFFDLHIPSYYDVTIHYINNTFSEHGWPWTFNQWVCYFIIWNTISFTQETIQNQISHPWRPFRCHPRVWEIWFWIVSWAKRKKQFKIKLRLRWLWVWAHMCVPRGFWQVLAKIGGFWVWKKRL